MIQEWFTKKFRNSDWRFVGRLPKQYERNLFLITPYTTMADYFHFYLAVSKITNMPHKFYIPRKWYYVLVTFFFKKHNTFLKPKSCDVSHFFETKTEGQRQVNVVVSLSERIGVKQDIDHAFYNYTKETHTPITLITIDRVDKMVKFHTVFYTSKDFERDKVFINRYFLSHERKNKIFERSKE